MMNKEILHNCSLDHVAVAFEDLEKGKQIYQDFGLCFDDETEIIESQGVEVAFAQIDKNARLELLSPSRESGPISKFLKTRGQGLHHICLRVPDIKKKCTELKEKGYILLNENPVQGANNSLVNFIHPRSTGGVLIELTETQ